MTPGSRTADGGPETAPSRGYAMPAGKSPRERVLDAACVVAVVLLAFWDLGGRAIWHRDIPRFAVIAREMIAGGDWLVPHQHGQPYANKPILFIWLVAGPSVLLGGDPTPFTLRLPSALALVGMALATGMWARARTGSGAVARWSSLFVATTLLAGEFGRVGRPDMLAAAFATGAAALLDRSILGVGRRSDAWVAGVLLGAGLLSKGPIVLVVPAALVLLPRPAGRSSAQESDGPLGGPPTIQRAPTRGAPTAERPAGDVTGGERLSIGERARRARPLIALLVAVVVAAMWIVPLWLREGAEFVQRLVVDQVKERALGRGNHRQGPLFYFVSLAPMLLPWAPLSIGAAVAFGWPAVRRRLGPATLALATLAAFVLLSAIPTKDPRYAIVLVPPLSIVAAQAASALCGRVRDERKAAGHLRALSGMAVALGVAAAGAMVAWPSSTPWVAPPAVLSVAAGLGGIRRARASDAQESPSESGARALAARWMTLLVLLVACGGAVFWAAFARYIVHSSVVENQAVAAAIPEGVPTAILMREGLEPDDLYEAVRRPISLHDAGDTPSPASAPRLVVVCLESDVDAVAKARGETPRTLLRRERRPEQSDGGPTVLVVLRFGA